MKNFLILLVCLIFVTSCTKEEFQQERDITIDQVDSMATVVVQVYVEYTERDTADAQYGLSGLFPFDFYGSSNMLRGNIFDDERTTVHSLSKTYHIHKDSLYTISDNLNFSDFDTYITINDSLYFSVNISVYNGIQDSLVSIPHQIEQYTFFAPFFAPYDNNSTGIESQTFDILNTIMPTSSKTFRIYTGNSPDNLVQTGSDLPINELNLGIANGYITANYTSSQPYNYQNQISFDYTE